MCKITTYYFLFLAPLLRTYVWYVRTHIAYTYVLTKTLFLSRAAVDVDFYIHTYIHAPTPVLLQKLYAVHAGKLRAMCH